MSTELFLFTFLQLGAGSNPAAGILQLLLPGESQAHH